ncbi:hypothetical protein R1sor_023953 [Riccia sorocarpa]|uniref:Uncharacterized protein n=1 Tax=Riccia sorocarpa TaxID=122646 RepID=A0ABD3GRA3_9MARC
MDKVPAYGAGDSGFDPQHGRLMHEFCFCSRTRAIFETDILLAPSPKTVPPPSARATHLRNPSTVRVPGGAGRPRITCWNDSHEQAGKTLENALGNKEETFDKSNEEIKKRDAGGVVPVRVRSRGLDAFSLRTQI